MCNVTSVMANFWRPYGPQPTRLLCLWDSPGKNTGVGCHALLRRLFPTQGLGPRLFARSALAAGFSTISTTWEARLPAVCVQLRSRVRLFVTPWTVACQIPVRGILQARTVEWVVISSSRGSSQLRNRTCFFYVSFIGQWVHYH